MIAKAQDITYLMCSANHWQRQDLQSRFTTVLPLRHFGNGCEGVMRGNAQVMWIWQVGELRKVTGCSLATAAGHIVRTGLLVLRMK